MKIYLAIILCLFSAVWLSCGGPTITDNVPRPVYDEKAVEAILMIDPNFDATRMGRNQLGDQFSIGVSEGGKLNYLRRDERYLLQSVGRTPNGCSTPYIARKLWEKLNYYDPVFTAACNTHDFCYKLGQRTYQYSRAKCDADFLHQMIKTCHDLSLRYSMVEKWRTACENTGVIMYSAVNAFGRSDYVTNYAPCDYEKDPDGCSFAW